MTGTITSSTRTVAFLRSTMTAATITSGMVEYSGGIWKAFSKEAEMELLVTWLMPHQQISPDSANSTAITECLRRLPLATNNACR